MRTVTEKQASNVPSGTASAKAAEVAGNCADALAYVAKCFEIATKKVKEEPAVIEMQKFFNTRVSQLRMSESDLRKPWEEGKRPGTPIEILQDHALSEALASFGEDVKDSLNIMFDYAINKLSEFVRAYTVDNKPLEAKDIAAMDTVFNTWLVTLGLISKDGVIYHVDENGKIKNENGEDKRADPREIQKLIETGKEEFPSFAEFVEEKTKHKLTNRNRTEADLLEKPGQSSGEAVTSTAAGGQERAS